MPVRQIAPGDRRGRKRFAGLERELMRAEPLFVSETVSDADKRLHGRSPYYEEMEHTMFIASSNGDDVARCAALVNRRWQRDKSDGAGFIGYFAASPGAGTAVHEMLDAAERWLAERGADRVIAPYNGAAFLGMGALTQAFERDPTFPMGWQPPQYADTFEGAGYRPTYPFWIYEIDFSSERYRTASTRARGDARCTVRPLEKKRWKAEIETLRSLFNESFREEWEFHSMTGEEFHDFFDQFKPGLDKHQFLIAEVDGEPAGFCLGIPDWTLLFRSLKGKLGPMQFVRLARGAKRYDHASLFAIGVLESRRGRRIGQTLAATLYGYYEERGLRGASYLMVNDDNLASRRLAESFGGTGDIRYTVFDKPLN